MSEQTGKGKAARAKPLITESRDLHWLKEALKIKGRAVIAREFCFGKRWFSAKRWFSTSRGWTTNPALTQQFPTGTAAIVYMHRRGWQFDEHRVEPAP